MTLQIILSTTLDGCSILKVSVVWGLTKQIMSKVVKIHDHSKLTNMS